MKSDVRDRIGRSFLLLGLVATVGCAHGGSSGGSTAPASSANDLDALVDTGMSLRSRGQCRDALRRGFEPAVAAFEETIDGQPVIAERDDPTLEAMQALNSRGQFMMIATRQGPDGQPRRIISTYYPDVLYFAAYCYVEIGDLTHAETSLRRAAEIIPDDPLYLAELGHIAHMRHQFADALPIFERAIESARALEARNPAMNFFDMSIVQLRHRCMRGLAYTLIELSSLDEAENIYNAILRENPGDQQARNELGYIGEIRRRSPSL